MCGTSFAPIQPAHAKCVDCARKARDKFQKDKGKDKGGGKAKASSAKALLAAAPVAVSAVDGREILAAVSPQLRTLMEFELSESGAFPGLFQCKMEGDCGAQNASHPHGARALVVPAASPAAPAIVQRSLMDTSYADTGATFNCTNNLSSLSMVHCLLWWHHWGSHVHSCGL